MSCEQMEFFGKIPDKRLKFYPFNENRILYMAAHTIVRGVQCERIFALCRVTHTHTHSVSPSSVGFLCSFHMHFNPNQYI